MPKNIIFILSDQHNAKVLAHEGHAQVKTPHLDQMAAEGTRFSNCITANPICTPSRVSFLSGQFPHNHGYYGLSGPNPKGLPSLLSHFRDHGYTTAAIGKIHCPDEWIEEHTDFFSESSHTSKLGRCPEYDAFLKSEGVDELEDHQHLVEFGDKGRQSMDSRPSPLSFDQSQEGWVANRGIQFMEEARERGKSFCLHLSFPRPHQCTTPCQEFWDLYDDIDESWLPPNANSDQEGKAPHLRAKAEDWRSREWPLFEPKDYKSARLRKLRGYLGAVSQVDHAVGRVLDFLRSRELQNDTIVVYSSDHGDYACEHDIMEKAPGICSDAITRIPYIWWGGSVPKGEQRSSIASSTDTANTLCSFAHLPLMQTSDGESLADAILGSPISEDRCGFTEFAWSKSVRKGKFRYVHYPRAMFPKEYPEGFGELYNLEDDPWEMTNLYFDQNHQTKIEELRSELLEWLITSTRPKTTLDAKRPTEPDPQIREAFRAWVNADDKIHPDRLRESSQKNYV